MPVKRTAKKAAKKQVSRKRTKIGFVGVGRIGANMARRLKDCGYPIAAVYDLDHDAAGALAT